MSIEKMFDHKCDIYHMQKSEASPGFNLPSSPSFSYGDEPDLSGVPCHFNRKGGTINVVQNEPQAKYEARIKLNLPKGTDIRINDKVVDMDTGFEYTAEVPADVRGHHQFVWLQRTTEQEPI